MQPMIGWSPSCTGSNSFGEWQHTNSNYSGAAPPTYPACLGYNDGGSIAAPPYWAQSIISFQLFSSGVPSNFSMPFGGFNSLGYPTYLGSQDIPIPNAQADIQVVPNVIFDYVSSRFGY